MGNKSMADNFAVLLDELVKAEQVTPPSDYSEGYVDGLAMAVSIIEGRVA